MIGIIISLVIGGIAGWLASLIMHTKGGLIRNIIVGIVGGFIGNWILGLLKVSYSGYLATIGVSVLGACVLLLIINAIFK